MNSNRINQHVKSLSQMVVGGMFTHYFGLLMNMKKEKGEAFIQMLQRETNNELSNVIIKNVKEVSGDVKNVGGNVNNIGGNLKDIHKDILGTKDVVMQNLDKSEEHMNLILESINNLHTTWNGCGEKIKQIGSDLLSEVDKYKEILKLEQLQMKTNVSQAEASEINVSVEKLNLFVHKVEIIANKMIEDSHSVLGDKTKFIPDINNLFPDFNILYEYLDTLSLIEELALLHIFIIITMLLTMFSIFGALFGNEVIKYFNLENRFPSLHHFFKIRSKLQKYYIIWNIIIILGLCLLSISADIMTILYVG